MNGEENRQENADTYCEHQRCIISTNEKYTFNSWADIWFEHHKDNITPTTQQNYKHILAKLKAYMGAKYLDSIKALDIEQVLHEIRNEGKSRSYLEKSRGMLYQIFNKAEANDLILKNPVRFAEKMRLDKGPPQRKEAFHADEVKKLMAELPYDRIGCSIRLMLGTGMRTQEILGLEPKHIEEHGAMIYIRQAVVQVKGTVSIGPPKSRDSYRDIPVPPNLRDCALYLRNTDKQFIWELGKEGLPCNPSCFRKNFKKAIQRIEGVRVLNPHCCRHTYVSQMQALGIDLPTIQSIVGHTDIDMTQHYLHVQESVRQEAVKRFSQAFCE